MIDQPLVSIVLPTYNGFQYLRRSVASCLSQTYGNIELIIVDDASTEKVADFLCDVKDPRMRIIRHNQNRGLPESLNSGFWSSHGEYLTWTSDDNWYSHEAIELMVSVLSQPMDVGFVYSDYWRVDEDGNVLDLVRVCEPAELLTLPANGVGGCFLYRRHVRQVVGDYDPRWRLVEDHDYWLRIARVFRVWALHEPLYWYGCHERSLTALFSRHAIQRKSLRLARHHGVISWPKYLRCLGDSNVDAAFFYHQQGRRWPTAGRLLMGLLQNPAHARNRGAWSVLLDALLGGHLAQQARGVFRRI